MAELLLHGRKVKSVFQLLGEHENDITCSLAWALVRSPSFMAAFLEHLSVHTNPATIVVRLQQYEREAGITDIEIESPGRFFLIVEAKRGWTVPTLRQLETYACRPSFGSCGASVRRILTLSECTREYALGSLGCDSVSGTDIDPVSWKEVATLAERASHRATHAERRLLGELLIYLKGLMRMQNTESNWVYVVSLGAGVPDGWRISWIDIVRERATYFHPISGGWPKEPPNYIAFRYGGRLQSIHHVVGWEVVEDLHSKFPEIPSDDWGPHFVYSLGPAFAPSREVRTGNIYPSGRVWCMLDTLFTSVSISEARDASKLRIGE